MMYIQMDGLVSGGYTLTGVSDYAYLKGGGRDIYLLGEIHEETDCSCTKNCYSPTDFIKALAESRQVDVFVEATYHKSYSQVYLASPMTDFIKQNESCLVKSKNSGLPCNFPNTRFHPVNIRVNGTVLGTLFNICLSDVYSQGYERGVYAACVDYLDRYDLYGQIVNYYDDLLSLRQMRDNSLYRADLHMMSLHTEFSKKYQKRYLHVIAKLQRNLASLTDDVRGRIKAGVMTYLQKFSRERRLFTSLREKFRRVLKRSPDSYIRLDKYIAPPNCDSLIFIFSLLQDVYTAARMYRQPLATMVAYVGGVHVINLSQILKLLTSTEWSHTRSKNCLTVSNRPLVATR